MTKYCRRVVSFLYADSSASPPLFVRGDQLLHTLFRGNDEVLSVDYCLSLRRIFGSPAVICERRPISSHALSRESRGGARKILRRFSCGNYRLDCRLRGNDEVWSEDYCLSLRRIFGARAVICERRPISSHARNAGTRCCRKRKRSCRGLEIVSLRSAPGISMHGGRFRQFRHVGGESSHFTSSQIRASRSRAASSGA